MAWAGRIISAVSLEIKFSRLWSIPALSQKLRLLLIEMIDKKNLLKLKACLGVTCAIQYPEKLFSFIDEQIRSVKWEDSKVLERSFEQLKSI